MKSMKLFRTMLLSAGVTLGVTLFTTSSAFAATYKTISGDSLYKISQIFNTTTTNLINDNKLTSTTIYPGQVLYVSCKTYTVQAGDSLYLIAKKFGITLDSLRAANSMLPDAINIGQVLNLPPVPVQAPAPVVTPAPAPQPGTTAYTSADVDLLSRLIMAEAQGESYTAKTAVGAVVLNRVKSAIFPNTIKDVIYQTDNGYYQFTPVLNGWINKPADADSIKAAYAALNGTDPTNGALYYFDDTVTNTWLLSKPVSIVLGRLIFSY